jgi:5-methylphenazine-1-carboxylate 1-monooxygenase
VVLRNRGAGPFGLLNLLDERCGGVFDDIDAVIPPGGARGVHEPLQGRGRVCDGALNSRAADHRAGARVARG